MDLENLLLTGLLIFAVVWASYTDVKARRIANWLTFGAAASALALRLAFGGSSALLAGFEGWLLGLAILLLPFVLGWMGAGDVKLLAALGAVGGPQFALRAAFLGCAAGAVLTLMSLVQQRRLGETLRNTALWIRHPLAISLQSGRRVPFAPALASGALVTLIVAGGLR